MIRPQLIVLTSNFIYLNQAPIELIVLVVRKGGADDDQSIELRNSLLILDQEWSPSSLVSTVCGAGGDDTADRRAGPGEIMTISISQASTRGCFSYLQTDWSTRVRWTCKLCVHPFL